MAKVNIKIEGLDKLQRKLNQLPAKLTKEIGAEIVFAAEEAANLAKAEAPADQGFIRQQISTKKIDQLNAEVISGASYSPFVEFGTGSKVQIPAGLEEVAAQFKGAKTGTFKEFFKAILGWVHRKGITGTYSVKTQRRTGSKVNQYAEDYSAAWAIAMHILRVGVTPHPFFFKQLERVRPDLIKRINNILNNP